MILRAFFLVPMMPESKARKFAIAHVGPEGRVALCEIFGDVIEADSWKEARKLVPDGGFADRPGYGVEVPEG